LHSREVQRSSGQYDHLARLPRAQSRQSSSRRSPTPSNGSAIRRLNGAGSSTHSASIQNNCRAGPRSQLQRPKSRNCVQCGPTSRSKPGCWEREFLDAETGRQKSSRKRANACRDQSPGSKWPEIPAEAPYLASTGERVVCGDWMVETEGTELPTPHPVIEPVSDIRVRNGNFRCRDGRPNWAHSR
jgi:hypothetical protein